MYIIQCDIYYLFNLSYCLIKDLINIVFLMIYQHISTMFNTS